MAGAYATERRAAHQAWISQYPFELTDGGLGVTLALTTTSGTSSRTALPTVALGEQVMINNFGNFPCHLRFGSSSVEATDQCVVIFPNIPYTLTIATDATHVAGMVAGGSGTTRVNIIRGHGN